MSYQWIACNANTSVFIHREKAILELLNYGEEQQKALFLPFDFEAMLTSCIAYFGAENISWEQTTLFYTEACFHAEHQLTVYPFMLETESMENEFTDYLYRMHTRWCLFEEYEFSAWKTLP